LALIKPAATPLPDGRKLVWYEFGDRDGIPCMFHPGAATSGLAGRPYHEAAQRLGVRLMSVDRPGLGHSDPLRRRRLRDWANDIAALADNQKLDRFTAFGHSGGGSHVLAIAAALADRVPLTVVASGLGPYSEKWMRADGMLSPTSKTFYRLLRSAEPVCRILFALNSRIDLDKLIQTLETTEAKTSDGVFYRQNLEMTRQLFAGNIDAARQGARGPVQDIRVPLLPWGFALSEVKGRVAWWHGRDDFHNVTFASGLETARRLPNCVFHDVDGAGHMAPLLKMDEILTALRDSIA
jgi:pimeloyl-ACP methyl ester carboxylesterase